jgi:hypothetical protein
MVRDLEELDAPEHGIGLHCGHATKYNMRAHIFTYNAADPCGPGRGLSRDLEPLRV